MVLDKILQLRALANPELELDRRVEAPDSGAKDQSMEDFIVEGVYSVILFSLGESLTPIESNCDKVVELASIAPVG